MRRASWSVACHRAERLAERGVLLGEVLEQRMLAGGVALRGFRLLLRPLCFGPPAIVYLFLERGVGGLGGFEPAGSLIGLRAQEVEPRGLAQ
jgi:hypothetical protein